MKVNFSIEDIEQQFDDEVIADGETIIGHQALKTFSEVEKGLWSVHFLENDVKLEVEVQLNASRVRAYTCECANFLEKGVCGHITAALHALRERRRRQTNEKEAAKQAKLDKEKTDKRQTMPSLLRSLPQDVLVDFLIEYAKQNKPFALAVKAHFTGDGTNEEKNKENFDALLETTYKKVITSRGNITPKGWIEVLTVLDTLKTKAQIAAKKGEIQQLKVIVFTGLPFVQNLMRRDDAPFQKLERRQNALIDLLAKSLELIKSVELRDEIWNFSVEAFKKNAKYRMGTSIFQQLLMRQLENDARGEAVLEILQGQMPPPPVSIDKRHKLNFRLYQIEIERDQTRQHLLELQILVLNKINRQAEITKLLIANNAPETLIANILEEKDPHIDTQLCKSLAEYGYQNFNSTYFAQLLSDLAALKEDWASVITYLDVLLPKRCVFADWVNYKFAFFKVNPNLTTAEWEKQVLKKVKNIEKLMAWHSQHRNFITQIFFYEKMWDTVFDRIVEHRSLDTLREMGVKLFDIDPKKTLRVQTDLITDYLDQHLGKIPAERIKMMLQKQVDTGGEVLVQQILDSLRVRYVGRPSVLEELRLVKFPT